MNKEEGAIENKIGIHLDVKSLFDLRKVFILGWVEPGGGVNTH